MAIYVTGDTHGSQPHGFDAYLFLTQIYTNTDDYIKAEAIYDQLESCRGDSPYAFDESKPLCPQSIRDKAAEQRNQN